MPVLVNTRRVLLERGRRRMVEFCEANHLLKPRIHVVSRDEWHFGVCAYYRPHDIHICLEHCGRPCGEEYGRNWTWPGSTADREPYGVIAHELGHHCDIEASRVKYSYSGNYGEDVCTASGEKPISGYCPNVAEWFAEMMRLFITNHALLQILRPKTHALLRERWTPVSHANWLHELGKDCPRRVITSLRNKMRVSAS